MNRRCRTCPAIFADDGHGDVCPACSPRAAAVKDPAAGDPGRRGGLKGGPARVAGLTPEQRAATASKAATARWSRPRRPKLRGCAAGDHRACDHYTALLVPLRTWVEDMEWCAICGAETPREAPDGAPVPHVAGCALAALIAPAPRMEAP